MRRAVRRKLSPDAVCWAVVWRVTEPLNSGSWLALDATTIQQSHEHVLNAVDAAVTETLQRHTDGDFAVQWAHPNFKQFVKEVHRARRGAP